MKTSRATKELASPTMGTEPTAAATATKLLGRSITCRQRLSRAIAPLLLLALALPMTVQAQFEYSVVNGEVTITNYTGSGGGVTIPDTLEGLPVTRIADEAFYSERFVTSVTIPDSVISIGDHAFFNCDGMKSLTLGNGVTSISKYAFFVCLRLTNVVIPASVTFIDTGAFANCDSLTNITVAAGNTTYSSLDGVLFNKNQTTLVQCPGGKLGKHYAVPNGVTTIGFGAFYYLTRLDSVTVPASVTNLQDYAFGAFYGDRRVYFLGDAPSLGIDTFLFDPMYSSGATLFYLPGTTGWSSPFAGRPAVLWNPHIVTDDGAFGVQAGQFGFTIMGAEDVPVAVEACSDLSNPDWTTITNLTCGTNGTVQFIDPEAADHSTRIYRFRPE